MQFSEHNHAIEDVVLTIEGSFRLTRHAETSNYNEKITHLTTLARQKISAVHLVAENDVEISFVSGDQLTLLGRNGQFESWQLRANKKGEIVLIVAGPGEQLTLFE